MTQPAADTPTNRNRRLLREAAERLLAGNAHSSDGRLTLKSLAEEAGVPRPYLYRSEYKAIAADFEHQTQRCRARQETPDKQLAEMERLRLTLGKAKELAARYHDRLRQLEEEVDVAASQVAFLAAQNAALRAELQSARSVVSIGRGPIDKGI